MNRNIHRLAQVMICAAVLLVAVKANALEDSPGGFGTVPQYHNAVVIVLDDSGSMREQFGGVRRLDAAKRGLKVVLRKVPRSTWVGLLALNAGWAYELAPNDAARMDAVVNGIETSGGTPLARNMKIGADRLLEEREKQFGYGTYRLLVVTDGEETEDGSAIESYPPEVVARGLALDVIGVGIGEEHSLRKHAQRYRGADDPAALDSALAEVLAEADSSKTDETGADIFQTLEGIPPEVAQAMIDALTRAENHPIGTKPPDANGRAAARRGLAYTPDPSQGSPPGNAAGAGAQPGCDGCQVDCSTDATAIGFLYGLAIVGLIFGRDIALFFFRR